MLRVPPIVPDPSLILLIDSACHRRLCEFLELLIRHCAHLYMQLVWLIISVSTGQSAIPIISIAMIAAVYGLQVRHL